MGDWPERPERFESPQSLKWARKRSHCPHRPRAPGARMTVAAQTPSHNARIFFANTRRTFGATVVDSMYM